MVKEEYNPQEGYTKGGGLRGPPKRWSGRGPAPARHIPWPEIFKHHLSVVEGHMKMLDMVRKHTVEGTGNWRTICTMVERAKEMLHMSKQATKSFVPPANNFDKIPIGSSSLSMYPGYSPADHQYGEAAQEFGQEWADAKRNGVDFQPTEDGPQYEIGQSKKRRKKSLEETKAELAEREALRDRMTSVQGPVNGAFSGNRATPGSGPTGGSQLPNSETGEAAWKARAAMSGASRSLPHGDQTQQKANEKRPRSKRASPGPSAKSPKSDSNSKPAFFIDSNPTPVNIPGTSTTTQLKRAAVDEHGDPTTTEETPAPKAKKSKRVKTSHGFADSAPLAGDAAAVESSVVAPSSAEPSASAELKPQIEFEDITAEVDARMAAKEERRKRKHEQKRKRESGNEHGGAALVETVAAGLDGGDESNVLTTEERPKKKKSKKRASSNEEIATAQDPPTAAIADDAADVAILEKGVETSKKRKGVSEEEDQETGEKGKKKKSKKGKRKIAA